MGRLKIYNLCPNDRKFYEKHYITLRKTGKQIAKEFFLQKKDVFIKLKEFGLTRSLSDSMKGRIITPETRKKRSLAMKGKINLNEKSGNWKGDSVGQGALHDWVRSRKQRPLFCEHCGIQPPRDLANISQQYKRDVNDFEWLCRRCHIIKDGRVKKNLKMFEKKLNNKLEKNLIKLRESGCTYSQLATLFNLSINTVHRYLKTNNLVKKNEAISLSKKKYREGKKK